MDRKPKGIKEHYQFHEKSICLNRQLKFLLLLIPLALFNSKGYANVTVLAESEVVEARQVYSRRPRSVIKNKTPPISSKLVKSKNIMSLPRGKPRGQSNGGIAKGGEAQLSPLGQARGYTPGAVKNLIQSDRNYLPYLQIEGMRLFNVNSTGAFKTDLFIPIWQDSNNMVFTDLRVYDGSGRPFEGNIQFGYRHISPEKQRLYGVYGAFDRKRTWLGNYFNQVTLGGEYWSDKWFVGGNIYKPIGKTTKDVVYSESDDSIWLTRDKSREEAAPGVDAEVGYEFTKHLTGYVGGYYFSGEDVGVKYGPKARLKYDWFLDNGDRILGVFDKVGFEAGVKHDKLQGTFWYLSANARIGWLFAKKPDLQGVARHMVDPICRDPNIITMSKDIREREPSLLANRNNLTQTGQGGSGAGGGGVDEENNNQFRSTAKTPQPEAVENVNKDEPIRVLRTEKVTEVDLDDNCQRSGSCSLQDPGNTNGDSSWVEVLDDAEDWGRRIGYIH